MFGIDVLRRILMFKVMMRSLYSAIAMDIYYIALIDKFNIMHFGLFLLSILPPYVVNIMDKRIMYVEDNYDN